MGWQEPLRAVAGGLPPELEAWAAHQPSLEAAWDAAPRADWLARLALVRPDLDDDARRRLLAAACDVVWLGAGTAARLGTWLRFVPGPLERAAAAVTRGGGSQLELVGRSRSVAQAAFLAGAVALLFDAARGGAWPFALRAALGGGLFLGLALALLTLLIFLRRAALARRPELAEAAAIIVPALDQAVARTNESTRAWQLKLLRRAAKT